jgi:hypothetical protein
MVAHDKGIDCDTVEIWFADEAHIGQKNKITRRWAKRGSRPSARVLAKNGYRLCKTPSRSWLRSYYGTGCMIVDQNNCVVSGCGSREYQDNLSQVEDFCLTLNDSAATT